jgi:hypothetical protein
MRRWVRDLHSARMLATAANAQLGNIRYSGRHPSAVQQALVRAALLSTERLAPVSVRLLAGNLELSAGPLRDGQTIYVPFTEPLLVEVISADRTSIEVVPARGAHRVPGVFG